MTNFLDAHFSSFEELLLSQSRIPVNSGHSIHKGTPREKFIQDFLVNHLPTNLDIGSGEIISAISRVGEKRHQHDIVLYKKEYPKINFGGGVYGFLAESVIATIEVKSTIDRCGIRQAVTAARALKDIEKNHIEPFRYSHITPDIVSFVVAYAGPKSTRTIYDWLIEEYDAQGIKDDLPSGELRCLCPGKALDGVFVMGKGWLALDNTKLQIVAEEERELGGYNWLQCDTERGSLLLFFLILYVAVIFQGNRFIDTAPYMNNSDFRELRIAAWP